MARAGLYREQIRLVQPATTVEDGLGGFVVAQAVGSAGSWSASSWSSRSWAVNTTQAISPTSAAIWAQVTQLRGGQVLALGKELDKDLFKITIRYRSNVDQADRVAWGARTMKILKVHAADERRTEITLYAVDAN